MTPEKKQQWLDALRSGKYPQVAGALHTDDGFCCLGVNMNDRGDSFDTIADWIEENL